MLIEALTRIEQNQVRNNPFPLFYRQKSEHVTPIQQSQQRLLDQLAEGTGIAVEMEDDEEDDDSGYADVLM